MLANENLYICCQWDGQVVFLCEPVLQGDITLTLLLRIMLLCLRTRVFHSVKQFLNVRLFLSNHISGQTLSVIIRHYLPLLLFSSNSRVIVLLSEKCLVQSNLVSTSYAGYIPLQGNYLELLVSNYSVIVILGSTVI